MCSIRIVSLKITELLLFLFTFTWVLLFPAGCQPYIQAPSAEQTEEKAVPSLQTVCAFYVNGRGEGSSFNSFAENRGAIDELSPLWYRLQGDGVLKEDVDSEALVLAEESSTKVIPLIAMAGNRSREVLINPTARKAAVENISRVVRDNSFDGVNIDLEIIRSEGMDYTDYKEGFIAFLYELREELPQNKRLDVCVLPPVKPPSHLAQIYDLKEIFKVADRVVMMAYDYSHSGTEPGPVAPLWWVEENIEYMLKMGLPPEKLSLGIAAYGYDWLLGGRGATARGNVEIKRIVEQYRAQVNWDQENQVPVIDYSDPEVGEREIWFENNASIKKKLELVNKYGLAGCSFWRLGFEEQGLWDQVEK
ncbi:MAG: glycosyl hydrolase family 18 protein [Thermacetogeniaceae bacterium]